MIACFVNGGLFEEHFEVFVESLRTPFKAGRMGLSGPPQFIRSWSDSDGKCKSNLGVREASLPAHAACKVVFMVPLNEKKRKKGVSSDDTKQVRLSLITSNTWLYAEWPNLYLVSAVHQNA